MASMGTDEANSAAGRNAPRRLKIALNSSAPTVENSKKRLEALYGRDLAWDEFFELLHGYVELPSGDHTFTRAVQTLNELRTFLEENGEKRAAGSVDVFSYALQDVLKGKLEARKLNEAIVGV